MSSFPVEFVELYFVAAIKSIKHALESLIETYVFMFSALLYSSLLCLDNENKYVFSVTFLVNQTELFQCKLCNQTGGLFNYSNNIYFP